MPTTELIKDQTMLLHTESFAPATTPTHGASKGKIWTARILTGLSVAFLLLDAVMKIVKSAPAVQGTIELGYPESVLPGIGIVLLLCTIAYVIPRTAILGAVLLTGYLGGAIATQVRVGNPLFSHVLFPIYFAVLLWLPLYLRDHRLRNIFSAK
jgi:hypothetical protein